MGDSLKVCAYAIREFCTDASKILENLIMHIIRNEKDNDFEYKMNQLKELINAYDAIQIGGDYDSSLCSFSILKNIQDVIKVIEKYQYDEFIEYTKGRLFKVLKNKLDLFLDPAFPDCYEL